MKQQVRRAASSRIIRKLRRYAIFFARPFWQGSQNADTRPGRGARGGSGASAVADGSQPSASPSVPLQILPAGDHAIRGAESRAALGEVRRPRLRQIEQLVAMQQACIHALMREAHEASVHRVALGHLQRELELARSMQASILPRHPPRIPGIEVNALMIPAHEIGGDFYDYFLLDEDHLAIVIADVSGKGIPAAFFMAISRTLLKSNAMCLREPQQVVMRVNDQLCADNEQMMFVTAFFGVLHLRSGLLEFVNAGHNPPVIRGGGCTRMLPRGQNVALAVVDSAPYRKGRATLTPGDTLLLYTDGWVEASDPCGRMFGEQRLLDTVMRHRPGQGSLPQELLQDVRAFERGRPQADDLACVAVNYLATA